MLGILFIALLSEAPAKAAVATAASDTEPVDVSKVKPICQNSSGKFELKCFPKGTVVLMGKRNGPARSAGELPSTTGDAPGSVESPGGGSPQPRAEDKSGRTTSAATAVSPNHRQPDKTR